MSIQRTRLARWGSFCASVSNCRARSSPEFEDQVFLGQRSKAFPSSAKGCRRRAGRCRRRLQDARR